MTDTAIDVTEPPFPEQAQLEDMVQDIIDRARRLGADGVEANRFKGGGDCLSFMMYIIRKSRRQSARALTD